MSIVLNGTTGITTPDVTADSGESLTSRVAKTGDTMTGDLIVNTSIGMGDRVIYDGDSSGAVKHFTMPKTTSRLSWGTPGGDNYRLNASGGGALLFGVDGDSEYFAIETHQSGVSHNEKFRVDTFGRVTMPYQPCASASYAGGDISPATAIPFNYTPITRGGISIGSNRFTVPVSGTYVVGYHHLATNVGTQINIRKNGAAINGGSGSYTQINPAASHGNGSVQNLVELAASDYIEFVVTTGVLHGNGDYNRMYIYLLG